MYVINWCALTSSGVSTFLCVNLLFIRTTCPLVNRLQSVTVELCSVSMHISYYKEVVFPGNKILCEVTACLRVSRCSTAETIKEQIY